MRGRERDRSTHKRENEREREREKMSTSGQRKRALTRVGNRETRQAPAMCPLGGSSAVFGSMRHLPLSP